MVPERNHLLRTSEEADVRLYDGELLNYISNIAIQVQPRDNSLELYVLLVRSLQAESMNRYEIAEKIRRSAPSRGNPVIGRTEPGLVRQEEQAELAVGIA